MACGAWEPVASTWVFLRRTESARPSCFAPSGESLLSMLHDLLSAGFARPVEGAFRCARLFLWKSESRTRSYGSRKHGRRRTLSAIGLNAPAGHSGGADGPLSRLRERAGERVLLIPGTYLRGKHTRRMG